MEHERTNWNDDRLDRLADQVDRLAGQVTALGKHIDDRFDAQNARIEKRFDNLTYGLIYSMASILAAFGGALFAINP
jgi:hypothetical protein